MTEQTFDFADDSGTDSSTPGRKFAVTDLHAAYPNLRSLQRGIALFGGNQILVQDEIEARPVRTSKIVWHFHTKAKIELHDNQAILKLGTEQLNVSILSPTRGKFEILSAAPATPPGQNQNLGVSDLTISLLVSDKPVTISVLISDPEAKTSPIMQPLSEWVALVKQ